ncbi:pyruvate, phosphate dikinase [Ignavigranum ruoffiae]
MQRVYAFNEGTAQMKDILGGKGANLAEMTRLGLPVPKGFTISAKACLEFLNHGEVLLDELKAEIDQYIQQLEQDTGKKFDGAENLLLVSVRSGAKISMPGMMDTILNVGLNDHTVETLAQETQDYRFAYDCYRRLLQMYGNVVFGMDGSKFERILDQHKKAAHARYDSDLTADQLKAVIADYKELYLKEIDQPFPQNVTDQIYEAVKAVFRSWNNDRAKYYRKLNEIPNDMGTAVNIQEMVFGNRGKSSGTGVLFTRNPATGEHKLFGEYLVNAQGEDVVAGIRTPSSIQKLAEDFPEIYTLLNELVYKLEHHYKDMQDIEFTIEEGQLYILQTRNGKRTAKSAFKVAVDLVKEGVITKEEALMRIEPSAVNQWLHPTFDSESLAQAELISNHGLPASPGSGTGQVVFTAKVAKEWAEAGKKVILVRQETSPEDIEGMNLAQAIVTSHGGMTSHAAVVARGMGKSCVVGVDDLEISEENKTVIYPGGELHEGDLISVDGSSGKLYRGEIKQSFTSTDESYATIMEWAEEVSELKVRMNAETLPDIQTGLAFGAVGIGLTRTEHMFFKAERLKEFRSFILSQKEEERQAALDRIQAYQEEDFEKIFRALDGFPANIRLLDPPLHEFLPAKDQDIELVAGQQGISAQELKSRIHNLKEVNPMLGHRGCRLGMTFPNLYLMQARAIMTSAIKLVQEGLEVSPEIMIPLVSTQKELAILKEKIVAELDQMIQEAGVELAYTVGTMIEIPRACFIADDLAQIGQFFSFGTNDLTQMTYGFSRDDAGKFINQYIENGVLETDPFQTIDLAGVGELVRIAVEKGRQANPNLKIGVCGELGGDPKSIMFFNQVGLDYVSCSPFRVPIAKIAAAQATIRKQEK